MGREQGTDYVCSFHAPSQSTQETVGKSVQTPISKKRTSFCSTLCGNTKSMRGIVSTWNTTWHVPWLQSWTPLQDVLPQSHQNELANRIISLPFCKSFKGSRLPTGVSRNSLTWYTRIFMPVHCIPLHFHSLLLNHKLHTPKCSTYTFQDWQTLSPAFPYAVASVLNALLNSLHLVNFYSSFRTQLPCHTLCEVVKSVCVCVFAAWEHGPALFIFLSPAPTQ